MYIEVPILNPFNFVDKNRQLLPNYNFKHFDGWKDNEQVLPFDTYKCYKQLWQNDDIAFLQVKADYSPIRVQVRNNKGLIVLSHVMSAVAVIGTDVYYQDQVAFDDAVFVEGFYVLEILAGDPIFIILESSVLHIKEQHEGTLLLKYSSNFNNSILWETGIYMTFRVNGVIAFDHPASIRTVYVDQPGSEVTVKGDPYRVFKLFVGCDGGTPPWVIDKLEEIIDQNNVEYDGKPFAPVVGATWNTKKIDRYPWAQWNIEMREVNNRRAKRFESTGLQEQKVVIDYIVEGRLFGPIAGSANDNTYTINEIE